MPKFGPTSLKNLAELHPKLQKIMNTLIQFMDVQITDGHRTQAEQDAFFKKGVSKVQWPNSKHNRMPSHAVDVVPWPVDWNNRERFVYMAGIFKGIAHAYGIANIRWGGDWDSDNDLHDQTFMDLPHFELVNEPVDSSVIISTNVGGQ